ncbi:hypothetical protein D9M72_461030 [compost metagenome]
MEVLPCNALRVRDPVLLAFRIAAGGLAFIEQRHVGRFGSLLQFGQFGRIVRLKPEVVDSGLRAAGRDGEVHARIFQHPLRVVFFHHRWFGCEEG